MGKDRRAVRPAEEAGVTREISRLAAGTGRFRRATVTVGLARLVTGADRELVERVSRGSHLPGIG